MKEPQNAINIFYNMSKLITNSKKTSISNVEDKWILSKLNNLTEKVTNDLENLHPHLAVRALQDFWLNDFSRGYIQVVRDRISKEDERVKFILKEVYITLLKLSAPFIPFIAEKAWQELKIRKIVEEESVHLCDWPKANLKKIDNNLEEKMDIAFKMIEKGLAERDKKGIGLKWPLAKAIIIGGDFKLKKEGEEIIKQQLNVKKILYRESHANTKDISVDLDTTITPELEAEGYAREISRKVQEFRKELGLEKKDKIKLFVSTDDKLKKILEKNKEFIMERTNSSKFDITEESENKENFKNKISFNIREKKGFIGIIVTSR